jgi:voltage-gated potassium channel Kch
MIHDIAIWKLALGGFVLACGSFILGFIIAAALAASGRASRMEEEVWGKELHRKEVSP